LMTELWESGRWPRAVWGCGRGGRIDPRGGVNTQRLEPVGRGRTVLTLSLAGADFGGTHRSVWGVCGAPRDGAWIVARGVPGVPSPRAWRSSPAPSPRLSPGASAQPQSNPDCRRRCRVANRPLVLQHRGFLWRRNDVLATPTRSALADQDQGSLRGRRRTAQGQGWTP
jgi:hypothetical protein